MTRRPSMPVRHCTQIKANGQRCRGWAAKGGLCPRHKNLLVAEPHHGGGDGR